MLSPTQRSHCVANRIALVPPAPIIPILRAKSRGHHFHRADGAMAGADGELAGAAGTAAAPPAAGGGTASGIAIALPRGPGSEALSTDATDLRSVSNRLSTSSSPAARFSSRERPREQ